MLRRRTLGNIVSENLHNPETDIADVYLKDGIETTYTTWSASDWITITQGKYLILTNSFFSSGSNSNQSYNALYDEDKNFMKNFSFGIQKDVTQAVLIVPDRCRYVRFSSKTSELKDIEIYRLDD